MNDLPEDIIAGGQRFKREKLQAFCDKILDPKDLRPGAVQMMPVGSEFSFYNEAETSLSHLLKIKHLFYASFAHRIDYRPLLKVLGLETIPMDLRGLKELYLGKNEILVIECLYDAQRVIDKVKNQKENIGQGSLE